MLGYYRVPCVTDSKNEFVWAETEPTECPVNPAHTINANGITIVKSRQVRDMIVDPYLEAVLPGASNVTANDRPAIQIEAGEDGWGAIQGHWPLASLSVAKMYVWIRFILENTGTGTVARIGARAKAECCGDDSSASWADTQYVDAAVTHTMLGEVFEALISLDASAFHINATLALQVGRNGSHANDTLDQAIQILGVRAEAH